MSTFLVMFCWTACIISFGISDSFLADTILTSSYFQKVILSITGLVCIWSSFDLEFISIIEWKQELLLEIQTTTIGSTDVHLKWLLLYAFYFLSLLVVVFLLKGKKAFPKQVCIEISYFYYVHKDFCKCNVRDAVFHNGCRVFGYYVPLDQYFLNSWQLHFIIGIVTLSIEGFVSVITSEL